MPPWWPAIILVLIPALAISSRTAEAAEASTLGGQAMGTAWTARWHAGEHSSPILAPERLRAEISRRIERIESRMSNWRDDSEISRFNSSESTDWFSVSSETVRVIDAAGEISRQSKGAFDITVSPLVELWGFGVAAAKAAPGTERLAVAQSLVGWKKLVTRQDPPAIRKTIPGLTINLSAIAKGYAVDVVAEFFESLPVDGYLVEIGGETRVGGKRPGGRPWRIGVEEPIAGVRRVRRVLSFSEGSRAVATSGDYRNRKVHQGRYVSHTLDPRTGQPVQHNLAAVTVVASDCMTADGLATMLMVLGPEEGLDHAKRHGIAALLLSRLGGEVHETATPEFLNAFPTGRASGWTATLWPVLALVVLAVGGLSTGVLLKGRGLIGSCGGLSVFCDARNDSQCRACSNPSAEGFVPDSDSATNCSVPVEN